MTSATTAGEAAISVVRRLSRSYAFRSQGLYRLLLRLWPMPAATPKASGHTPLLTMCGRSHLLMLENSLFSMARAWSRLPPVKVVSDGTESCATIARRLRWWPTRLEVVDWREFLPVHATRGREELVAYAQKNPFGRKLAAIVAEAERGPVLWCDTDILFFDDFSRLLDGAAPASPFVYATQDCRAGGYDEALLESDLRYLLSRPPVNTGLVLCGGDFYERCGLAALVSRAIPRCNSVTEQTILAHAVYELGRIEWDLERVEISASDLFTLSPVGALPGRFARHYLSGGMRHMFWRDAVGLRAGLLPRQ